ncbi:hypothetical protein Q8A67_010294 [Cirrhinus molitorella]|uniref:Uncharacterized protein n=1 Tax=Cirrhinus molitorella TaxID=172907 RepID=A0AA88TQB2_9TELE|nr:hypothetical protein Q8A67_010294 [Cirrhinus molitorella]
MLLLYVLFVLGPFGRDRGLVVCCKPELQMVLERRKREQTQREEGEQSRSPLEQVLLERQQKHQEMMKEKEDEQRIHEEVQLLEFVRVRQNLRKVHTALQKKFTPESGQH